MPIAALRLHDFNAPTAILSHVAEPGKPPVVRDVRSYRRSLDTHAPVAAVA